MVETAPTGLGTAATAARGQRLRGLMWAGLALAIFSGWFVVTRLSVTRELRTWDIVALRFGIGGLVLLPVLLRPRHWLPARLWREGLLLAFLWGVPFVLFVAIGLQLTSATQAPSVTPGLMPVLAGLIGWAVLGESPSASRWSGYAVIVAGVALLFASPLFGGLRSGWAGPGALVMAAALWAAYTLRFRRGELSSLQAAALVCFWSAVVYVPFYCLSGVSRLGRAPWQEVGLQVLYQGLLMSVVAILAYNRAVALLGSVAASAIVGLVPVVATVVAVPVLGEVPSLWGGIATLAIAVGVMLTARSAAPSVVGPGSTR